MEPVVATVVVSAVTGVVVAVVVARAPVLDPTTPRLSMRFLRREVRLHPRLARVMARRLDPARWTGLLLTGALGALVVASAAIGILLLMVYEAAGLARSDMPLARWAAERATSTSTDVLRGVSTLGGTAGVVIVAAAVAAIVLRRDRNASVIPLLVMIVGGQFALVALVKGIVARARPELLPLSGFAGDSFPSGHAAAAAATYACAALVLGRGTSRSSRIVLGSAAGAVAAAVAATRVLLGVHWFTDVLAGTALGWGWFALCSIAFGGRALRFGRPVAAAADITP